MHLGTSQKEDGWLCMPWLRGSSFASYQNSWSRDFRFGLSPLPALYVGTHARANLETLQGGIQRPLREENPQLNLKRFSGMTV